MTASEELGSIKIAAIDNGLAFPFKHPDEWRTCNDTHTAVSTEQLPICSNVLISFQTLSTGHGYQWPKSRSLMRQYS